jgi:hypothetical protein
MLRGSACAAECLNMRDVEVVVGVGRSLRRRRELHTRSDQLHAPSW